MRLCAKHAAPLFTLIERYSRERHVRRFDDFKMSMDDIAKMRQD